MPASKTNNLPDDEYQKRLHEGLDAIGAEVASAKSKFPDDFVNLHEGWAVMYEEVDEVLQIMKQKAQERDPVHLKKELTQVAAMALRMYVELTGNES